jgi:hypothetical protein
MQIKVKCGKTLLLNLASATLALVGVLLLIASFQTFAVLKSIADSLLSDHNFNSLTQSNIVIFKIYLVATGLVLLVLAYFIRFQWQRLKHSRLFIRQFMKDIYLLKQAIKLEKSESLFSYPVADNWIGGHFSIIVHFVSER